MPYLNSRIIVGVFEGAKCKLSRYRVASREMLENHFSLLSLVSNGSSVAFVRVAAWVWISPPQSSFQAFIALHLSKMLPSGLGGRISE